MILTIIEYGGIPRQIECESFEFRGNQVTNWIRIKKADGCEALIHNVCVIKTQAESNDYDEALNMGIKALEQEPKTGHWIMTSDYITTAYGSLDYVKCSCCDEESLEEGWFCPNCGAMMQ